MLKRISFNPEVLLRRLRDNPVCWKPIMQAYREQYRAESWDYRIPTKQLDPMFALAIVADLALRGCKDESDVRYRCESTWYWWTSNGGTDLQLVEALSLVQR